MTAAQAAGGDHDSVNPPIHQQVEITRFAFRIVGRVAEEDRVTEVPRRVLDGPDELRKERILDVRDDQPERSSRSLTQRAGDT